MKKVEKRNETFERIVQIYLEKKPDQVNPQDVNVSSELEIRFHVFKEEAKEGGGGPIHRKPLTRMDYDNAVRQLYASGFTPLNGDIRGQQMLRMYGENMRDARIELCGTDIIQDYCFNNSLQTILSNPKHEIKTEDVAANHSTVKIRYTQKMAPRDGEGVPIPYVDVHPFRFRVSYKMEKNVPLYSAASLQSFKPLLDWKNTKKTYRYMNRVRFAHPDLPVFADLSIIKMSKNPEYTIQESGVLSLLPLYEIELEIDNQRCGAGSPFQNPKALLEAIRKAIRIILQSLQGSPFPVSYDEQDTVLRDYMVMVHNGSKKWEEIRGQYQNRSKGDWSRYFVGPSSKTLQWENMAPVDPEEGDVNRTTIQHNYTVTDKADGERKMLYIGSTGRIYLIDINMKIAYTGSQTNDKELFQTLLDGEHILQDRKGAQVNIYAAFDLYYLGGKNCRMLPFVRIAGQEDMPDERFRLHLLEVVTARLTTMDVNYRVENTRCHIYIRCKKFYAVGGAAAAAAASSSNSLLYVDTIFEGCRRLLRQDLEWDYETDGLIFTPCDKGVAGIKTATDIAFKHTWSASFKWKPPQYNTVDFMVRVVKEAAGNRDLVKYDISSSGSATQPYKMLSLWCGCNPERDLKNYYCDHALNETLPERSGAGPSSSSSTYKPVRFIPSVEPYDVDAYLCKIYVAEKDIGVFTMMIEGTQEVLEENTIVEFRYDLQEADPLRRWKPIRIRHDKTEQLRLHNNNFGNSYEVANSNWYSIHHPVTMPMLRGEEPVPRVTDADDEVYYNRKMDDRIWQRTRGLRDFHNKYVKDRLIQCALMMVKGKGAGTSATLIDLAVGKAGDLHKWVNTPLQFVLGIDVSRDNITNAVDGACKRYIEWRLKNRNKKFRAVFLQGDSGKHILNGDSFVEGDGSHRILNCLVGKSRDQEHKGVDAYFGIAKSGFTVCSCQFAMHYFFENKRKLNEFLRNVCEMTAEGGYFIGTCYDGRTVFEKLRGASMPIMATYEHPDTGEPVEMFKIERKFSQEVMENDATSVGYRIDVYQETINKVFPEYLVNFDYFQRLIAEYGFDLADEAKLYENGLESPTGLFKDLFEKMVRERGGRGAGAGAGASVYGYAQEMTEQEKSVSFLNRYFIFRKNRAASADLVYNKQMAIYVEGEKSVEEAPQENERETIGRRKGVRDTAQTSKPMKTAPVKRVMKTFEVGSDEESSEDEDSK